MSSHNIIYLLEILLNRNKANFLMDQAISSLQQSVDLFKKLVPAKKELEPHLNKAIQELNLCKK